MAEAETRAASLVPRRAAGDVDRPRHRLPAADRLAARRPACAASWSRSGIPAGATVAYDAAPVPGLEHHLWLLDGELTLEVGGATYQLRPGDALRYVLNGPSRFTATGRRDARYVHRPGAPMSHGRPRDTGTAIDEWRPDHRRRGDDRPRRRHARRRAPRRRARRRRRQLRRALLDRRRARVLDRRPSCPACSARRRRVLVAAARRTGSWAPSSSIRRGRPNQPHRAEVLKLLVHPDARRRGIARALMVALETWPAPTAGPC